MGSASRLPIGFAVAPAALIAVVIALIAWPGGGTDYRVHAQFYNAGQVVTGGLVQVAGQTIGKVGDITLTEDGHADLELRITDERFVPLRSGSRFAIRSVGQATITNRYIDIAPGPDNGETIRDGTVIPASQTQGIVDLDEILNAVDPDVRADLRDLFANIDEVYAGSSATTFNRMLKRLRPAMTPVADLAHELGRDAEEIERLITAGDRAANALASRADHLDGAVRYAARTFDQVSRGRQHLDAVLRRAPHALRAAGRTLDQVSRTAVDLRPALRAIPPAQPSLRRLLRDFPPALDPARGTIDALDRILPTTRTVLQRFTELEAPASTALRETGRATKDAQPMLEVFRYYGSDLILGVVNGIMGIAAGGYNAYGHFVRANFVQNPQTLLGGALGTVLPGLTGDIGLVPGIINTVTGLNRRCPGAGAPPSMDGSSPWVPKEGICDPKQTLSPLVNSPTSSCRNAIDCYEPSGDRVRGDGRARKGAGR